MSLKDIDYLSDDNSIVVYSCLCKFLKNSKKTIVPNELYIIVKKCKKLCNFCKLHKSDVLYTILKKLPYSQIREFIDLDTILQNPLILEDIANFKSDNVSFEDLLIILEQKELKNIASGVVNKICSTVKKILINQKSSNEYDDKDIPEKTSAILLLEKLVNNEALLFKQYDIIMNFVLDMLEANLIHKLSDIGIHLADFSMLLQLSFCRLEKKNTDVELLCIEKIARDSTFFRITIDYFPHLLKLPYYLFDLICKKLDNIIELMIHTNVINTHKIKVSVNPTNIIKSLKLDESILETEIFIDKLTEPKGTYIEYMTDEGTVGIDMSGLTKDFYSLISTEIHKYLEDVDGYMMPMSSDTIHVHTWEFFGIIVARSIFMENLSPMINMHPVICYLMLTGTKTINIKNFFENLEPFDIDYLNNTKKVLMMNDIKYREFMNLQCEDIIPKSKYIGKYICEKYLYSSAVKFINGFRRAFARYCYGDYISQITFFRYIKGEWKYDIMGNTPHSLKKNLTIVGENVEIDSSDSSKKFIITKTKLFENIFLEVLEHLNNTDLNKLKLFIKFWYGTAAINTFNTNKGKISVTKQRLYGCFQSHTCFNTLDVEAEEVKSSTELFKRILSLIDNTLNNQKISESAGFRMQFM
jgi:hypothetical protein